MNRLILIPTVLFCLLFTECQRVPVTGRSQMNLLPESMVMDMSLTNYRQFLSEHRAVSGSGDAEMVKRAGDRISKAAGEYLRRHKQSKRVAGYRWEYNLVNENIVNAWCMPGGKVVVYSGLLPVSRTEAGLAVVMGHEIAHAIARHGNERMSQLLLTQMGGVALSVALSEKPQQTRDLFLTAYGIGTALGVLLPYSRSHESEADKIGLIFMAMAGYDPREAVSFWERMAAQKQGKMPGFISTHPSDETRIKRIKEFLPTAMKFYNNRQ